MCSSQRPLEGADSEPQFDPGATYDNVCERCGRDVFGYEHLYAVQVDTKLRWYCVPCYDRYCDWFAGDAA